MLEQITSTINTENSSYHSVQNLVSYRWLPNCKDELRLVFYMGVELCLLP